MSTGTYDEDRHYQLWWLLRHARVAMYKARAKELYRSGITAEDVAVLFAVHAIGDEATPAQISRFIMREAHSVSGLIDRMEKRGLITKKKDLKRKNMVRITITEKGQQAYKKASKRESIHRIMSAISDSDCEHLAECLQKLLDRAMKEAGIKSKPGYP